MSRDVRMAAHDPRDVPARSSPSADIYAFVPAPGEGTGQSGGIIDGTRRSAAGLLVAGGVAATGHHDAETPGPRTARRALDRAPGRHLRSCGAADPRRHRIERVA